MTDASVPEQLGRAIGRHLPTARVSAGLALTAAALGMFGLFVWAALVPFHYESSGPPIGRACSTTGVCFEVDQDALDQAFEDDMNRSNRIIGTLGAVTSGATFLLGWRLWRSLWRQHSRTMRRARTVVTAACLSPVAAGLILVVVGVLYWSYSSVFE